MKTCPPALLPDQVVDSGLDETSCFFADGDGQVMTHGYFFEELSDRQTYYTSQGNPAGTETYGYYSSTFRFGQFEGGDFSFDLSRRKVRVRVNVLGVQASTVMDAFGSVAAFAHETI